MAAKAASSFAKATAVLWSGAAMSAFADTPAPEAAPAEEPTEDILSLTPYEWRDQAYNDLNDDGCTFITESVTEVARKAGMLWNNLQILENTPTIMGHAVTAFSKYMNVPHCFDSGMSIQINGGWHSDEGIVRITMNPYLQNYKILGTQSHELTHGIQQKNGVLEPSLNWDIYSFQASTMACEASAIVGEYLLAIELRDNKMNDLFTAMEQEYELPMTAAQRAYARALKKGKDKKEALLEAGAAAWPVQLREQDWLDTYNNRVLIDYLQRLYNSQLQAPTEKYSVEAARLTGKITPDFNFTANIQEMPSPKKLFGNNERMEEAFKYVELVRLAIRQGHDSEEYLTMLEKLEKERNLFLGVDLWAVMKQLEKPDNKWPPLEAMTCYAASVRCPGGDKEFDPTPYLVPMRAPKS